MDELARRILTSKAVADGLRHVMDSVVDTAEHVSPVRTGRYMGSWSSQLATLPGGFYRGKIHNSAPYSWYLERGTRKMDARMVLQKAAVANNVSLELVGHNQFPQGGIR